MLTFTTLSLPPISLAMSSSDGPIMRHGPHHSAQKSTSTGVSEQKQHRPEARPEHLRTTGGSLFAWQAHDRFDHIARRNDPLHPSRCLRRFDTDRRLFWHGRPHLLCAAGVAEKDEEDHCASQYDRTCHAL